jgi:hypothetical protein
MVDPTQEKRDSRRTKRMQRLELIRPKGFYGEGRGWQIMSSDGMPVMQLIEGGRCQPLVQREHFGRREGVR